MVNRWTPVTEHLSFLIWVYAESREASSELQKRYRSYSSTVECLTDTRVLLEPARFNGFACNVEEPKDTPPLVVPEGASSSLDSPDNSEHASEAEVGGTRTNELLDESMTDPQFPEPPAEGIYLDRDEKQEPTSDYATQSMIDRNVQRKSGDENVHSSSQFFEQSASYPASSDEQMRDYCFVEHSGLQKNDVVETGEGPVEEENSPGFEPPHPENGHNSEESCGSFLLIKSGAAVDQEVVQNLQTRSNGATGSAELVSEPPAYSELQCGLVVETAETNSNSHLTQPVESHSPSEFSYHSETRFEQGLQQPFMSVKSADLEFDSPLQADETALQDTSMDTTVGVSELLSDQTCPEPQTQTLTCYEDLTGSIGVEQGYQTSFDGGSSYHDDVPLEETDDFQCKEVQNNDVGQMEIQVPHVQEQPVCITEDLTHLPKGVPDAELYGVVEETPRPSFQEICADLDRKKPSQPMTNGWSVSHVSIWMLERQISLIELQSIGLKVLVV
ncbi:hypothetical protein CSKR_202855, partial [Clonorchis sinensis]